MILTSEKDLRRIIREELERGFGNVPENVISMKSDAGGEIIMPNPIREQFDQGNVRSLADIT